MVVAPGTQALLDALEAVGATSAAALTASSNGTTVVSVRVKEEPPV